MQQKRPYQPAISKADVVMDTRVDVVSRVVLTPWMHASRRQRADRPLGTKAGSFPHHQKKIMIFHR
jgi:hypothetical protein